MTNTKDESIITGLTPPAQLSAGTIRGGSTAEKLKRGTILSKSSEDGYLVITGTAAAEGETLEPYCILAEDIQTEPGADINAAVYKEGCFDPARLITAPGYTLTDADADALRVAGIFFKAMA